MIHIYKYSHIIPIFRNTSFEGLENTSTMFNDSITLHRNVNNVLNFKLTDRDRRSVDIDNVNITVKIVDLHSTLIVDTFYLSPTDNRKIFKATLPASSVNQLLPRRDYNFIVSLIDANGEEEALYIDHDFMMGGTITVVDNYSDIAPEKVEGYIQRMDRRDKKIHGEHCLENYIDVNEDFIKAEFMTYDDQNTVPVKIKLQKHREKYFPVDTDDDIQWEDYTEANSTLTHTWSNMELKKGKYRAVIVSDTPSEHFFVLHHIKRL